MGYEAGSVFEKLGGNFEFMPALVWWVSGAASAVLFFAIGMLLEQQEEMRETLHNIREEMPRREKEQLPPAVVSNSRSSMDSLKDYKLNATD